jgi:hypothetical protein
MRADPANTLVVCIDVVVSPRSSQDLRPKRRPHAKTWEDIEELVSKEHKRVRERAAKQIGGASAGDGEQVSLILAGGVREGTPKKAKKPVAKDAASITEIFDDDAKRTKPGGVLGDIDFEYIMWGYSQKVQLAGVCCSEHVLHTWFTWPPCFEPARCFQTCFHYFVFDHLHALCCAGGHECFTRHTLFDIDQVHRHMC